MDVDRQAAVQASRAAGEEKVQQTTERRFEGLVEFEAVTGLKKGTAPSNGNNCLYYSVAQCSGLLHPSLRNYESVAARMQEWRKGTHDSLMPRLQKSIPDGNSGWDKGIYRADATRIFQKGEFSKPAHIHELANRFEKSILVLQAAGEGS